MFISKQNNLKKNSRHQVYDTRGNELLNISLYFTLIPVSVLSFDAIFNHIIQSTVIPIQI